MDPRPMSDLGGPPNRNRWLLPAALLAFIAVLAVVAVLATRDDDPVTSTASGTTTTEAFADATTTTEAVTTTTSRTTSTAAGSATTSTAVRGTSTTAAGTRTTIAAARCDPRTSSAKPAEPAMAFYDAWTVGDRACAERLGTDAAVGTLFALKAGGPDWTFQGCDADDDEPGVGNCAFTYEGGSTHFKLRYANATGWSIFEVYQVAD